MSRFSTVVLVLLGFSCGNNPPGPDCRVGADCASGVCTREGRCEAPLDAGAGGGTTGGGATGGGGGATGGG
ncbi:MAG: hypothetical protein SFW67_15925, partial [Myxococcaceae bacterium]|nr:hypothetical protein [Myxococcaceae bacterium]